SDREIELRIERLKIMNDTVVAGMALDVTQRVASEREVARARELLEKQERMRVIGDLASGVAHDLNNTLNAVSLRIAMLRRDPRVARKQSDNLSTLVRILDDASTMVGRVQDFARQRHDPPTETLDLAAVLRQAIDMIRPELEKMRLAG